MLKWTEFVEQRKQNMSDKICFIMRGLPGAGKSTMVKQLLTKYNADYRHVFSTDSQFTRTSDKILNLGHVSSQDMSVETALSLCQDIFKMWYGAKWTSKKDAAKPQFLELKKLFDAGQYHEALSYFQSAHALFSIVEYTGYWDGAKLGYMHKLNLDNFKNAVDHGVTPVIVDNVNAAVREVKPYAEYATEAGYKIIIQEPNSPHWNAHKELFADKHGNRDKLDQFASVLADKNTHSVPLDSIRNMMNRWVHNMQPKHLTEDK